MEKEYNKPETVYSNLKEEIKSLANKGYTTIFLEDRNRKDKRKFIKIYSKNLNDLIYNTEIDRKYINFFILLVNLNAHSIEPDTNLIRLPLKKVAENMGYSTVHIYNNLNILQRLNLIDFYFMGKSKYIIINPKYYAKFYDIRYMYSVEYAFENKKIDMQDLIGKISIFKDIKKEKKNKEVEVEVKQFLKDNLQVGK